MGQAIEISRELAERILGCISYEEADELRAILAAPVVERKPLAYSYKEYVWATGLGAYVWRDKLETERPNTEDSEIKDLVPLYTSQPAPVAVVLPERINKNFYGEYSPHDTGWNACLDKVKELNQ